MDRGFIIVDKLIVNKAYISQARLAMSARERLAFIERQYSSALLCNHARKTRTTQENTLPSPNLGDLHEQPQNSEASRGCSTASPRIQPKGGALRPILVFSYFAFGHTDEFNSRLHLCTVSTSRDDGCELLSTIKDREGW